MLRIKNDSLRTDVHHCVYEMGSGLLNCIFGLTIKKGVPACRDRPYCSLRRRSEYHSALITTMHRFRQLLLGTVAWHTLMLAALHSRAPESFNRRSGNTKSSALRSSYAPTIASERVFCSRIFVSEREARESKSGYALDTFPALLPTWLRLPRFEHTRGRGPPSTR